MNPAMNSRMKSGLQLVLVAVRATLLTLVLTGLLYPLVVTGLALLLFPGHARGSLVKDEQGRVVGSALIGQGFALPGYFHPRPSANNWDAQNSGGSNLGPTSKALHDRAEKELAQLERDNPEAPRPVPVELVTASGSGLDPELSPVAAAWQVARVAKARRVARERVEPLVAGLTSGRTLGILGEPRVNVLQLNLALDRQFGRPPP